MENEETQDPGHQRRDTESSCEPVLPVPRVKRGHVHPIPPHCEVIRGEDAEQRHEYRTQEEQERLVERHRQDRRQPDGDGEGPYVEPVPELGKLHQDYVVPGVASDDMDPYKWHTGRKRDHGGEDAIEAIDVVKQFGKMRIQNGLNLGVPDNMISMLLGPSGTGKSVFIKLVVGLLYPDSGDILVHGESVPNMTDDELFEMRKKFGLLFQDGALFGSMDVFDNTAFPLRQHTDKSEDEIGEIVNRRLREVGLAEAIVGHEVAQEALRIANDAGDDARRIGRTHDGHFRRDADDVVAESGPQLSRHAGDDVVTVDLAGQRRQRDAGPEVPPIRLPEALGDRLPKQAGSRKLVLGDFNDWFWVKSVRGVLARICPVRTRLRTFPAKLPMMRLDRIYASEQILADHVFLNALT